MGKYEEAIKYYQTVVDSDEKNQEVKRQLATAYFKNDELDKSREILEKIERAYTRDARFQSTLGHIDFREGKFEAANKRFQAAVKLNKKFYPARYWLGMALKASGKPEVQKAAEEEFRRVTEAIIKDNSLASTLCDAHRQYAEYLAQRLGD